MFGLGRFQHWTSPSSPPLKHCSPVPLIARQSTGPVWERNVYNGSTSSEADLGNKKHNQFWIYICLEISTTCIQLSVDNPLFFSLFYLHYTYRSLVAFFKKKSLFRWCKNIIWLSVFSFYCKHHVWKMVITKGWYSNKKSKYKKLN